MTLSAKTELDAVNLILRNMDEAPVTSLSGDLPLEASVARDTLTEASEAIQVQGWYFNTEYVTLQPNGSDIIALPSNTLSVRAVGESRNTLVTNRNGQLYNITPFESSATFDGPIKCEIIYGLAWDDLIPSARDYIAWHAAQLYQRREIGDELNVQTDMQQLTVARTVFISEQHRNERPTMYESNSVYDVLAGGGDYPIRTT